MLYLFHETLFDLIDVVSEFSVTLCLVSFSSLCFVFLRFISLLCQNVNVSKAWGILCSFLLLLEPWKYIYYNGRCSVYMESELTSHSNILSQTTAPKRIMLRTRSFCFWWGCLASVAIELVEFIKVYLLCLRCKKALSNSWVHWCWDMQVLAFSLWIFPKLKEQYYWKIRVMVSDVTIS